MHNYDKMLPNLKKKLGYYLKFQNYTCELIKTVFMESSRYYTTINWYVMHFVLKVQ